MRTAVSSANLTPHRPKSISSESSRIPLMTPVSMPLSEKLKTLIHYVLRRDSLKVAKINASNTLRVINTASQTSIIPADSMMLFTNGKKIIFNTIEFVQIDSVYHLQRVQGLLLD